MVPSGKAQLVPAAIPGLYHSTIQPKKSATLKTGGLRHSKTAQFPSSMICMVMQGIPDAAANSSRPR
jgi:hypothetical protein